MPTLKVTDSSTKGGGFNFLLVFSKMSWIVNSWTVRLHSAHEVHEPRGLNRVCEFKGQVVP